MLSRMAKHVDLARKDPKQKVLISAVWAAMLVGFFDILRKDNITAGTKDPFNPSRGLRRTDMGLQPKQLWLILRVAKTIQFGGEPHVLGLVATNCAICPVRAVREHLALTTNVGPKAHLFITKPVGPKGAAAVPLSHAALVSGIRKLLTAIGMDPLKFSGHSLRRGGATLAYDSGIREMAI